MESRKNGGDKGWILKKLVFGICLFFTLSVSNTVQAINFYENGEIHEGEIYPYVSVFNDATVNMTGGSVTNVFATYDSSTANIFGGYVSILGGGELSSINLMGNTTVDRIEIADSSVLNMNDGTIGIVVVDTLGGAYLRNGVISEYLRAYSTVDIYGYGFAYNPDAWEHGGQLKGYWSSGTEFSIDLVVGSVPGASPVDTWSHITLHEIPEPGTLAMLTLGALIWPRRNSLVK